MKRTFPLVVAGLLSSALTAQVSTYGVGQVVNDFTVTDTDGNQHNLYSITASGKHVMLDFFFDTCGPCQQRQAFWNQMYEAYGCNSAQLYMITINDGSDSDAEVIAYEQTFGGPGAHSPAVSAQGGSAAVDAAFGINAYPTFCLIGPDNRLLNGDIWPVNGMSNFVAALPAGANIQPAPCPAIGTGINQQTAELFSVSPNPTTGVVTITRNGNETLAVQVLDMLGRVVFTPAQLTADRTTFDLGQLPSGQYLVRANNGNGTQWTQRLTVAH